MALEERFMVRVSTLQRNAIKAIAARMTESTGIDVAEAAVVRKLIDEGLARDSKANAKRRA
jgi:hypothetical protein